MASAAMLFSLHIQCSLVLPPLNTYIYCIHYLQRSAREGPFRMNSMVENVEIRYFPRGLNSAADDLAKTARCPVENALDQPPIATRPVHEIEKFIRLHGDQVLVQWKGYPDCSDFTWELESDLRDDLQNDPLVDSLKEAVLLTEGHGAPEDH
eukprot:gb/GECG01003772.1/.p1 GENE.gb/GECG01003772.1/~~gb/GECG01003772.1/.p1  ORF type:complete len:152 (+),score=11.20 gb/GECG01003772.1/:1-456(+)